MNFFIKIYVALFSFFLLEAKQEIDTQRLIEHVQSSIKNAYSEKSKLTHEILSIDGMSSPKVRHLLNNLCSFSQANYLEIGVYRGSTFISALYQNTNTLASAIAIDNWSEFGYQQTIFTTNTSKYLPQNSFKFYEQDAFGNIQYLSNESINIYFYDGNHSVEAQRKAFTHYNHVFTNTFIAIIDDWNWEQVKKGTKMAFTELGYNILFEEELPAYQASDINNWWNGIYIAVIKKN